MHVVVVVEDEPLILMEIADHLIEEGFKVLEARHADEALAILALDPSIIDVLFTDVQMPGEMDGVALSHHVSTHWPGIGLLVTSAHLAEHLPKGARFVPKPYHRAQIVRHVRELATAA